MWTGATPSTYKPMSASPFLSHLSNPITPFSLIPTKLKFPSPFFAPSPSKHSSITSCSSPTNGANIPKIEGGNTDYETLDSRTKSAESILHSGSTIKAPTAPWMNGPLLVKHSEFLESKRLKNRKDFAFGRNGENPDMGLSGKVGGGRGRVSMKKIFKGIEKLEKNQNSEEIREIGEDFKFRFAPGDLWGNGDCGGELKVEEKHVEVQESNEFDIPLVDVEVEREGKLKKLPWEREERRMVIRRVKKEKVVIAAELSLDGVLLERLRSEAAMMRKWVKVKKAGVTQAVVYQVHSVWKNNELALIKFDIPLCRNMDRAREIVEKKTGGLVVWTHKDFLAVYRGCNYESGSKHSWTTDHSSISDQENSTSIVQYRDATTVTRVNSGANSPDEMIHENDILHTASLYEREGDRLLDGLGPRFVDWWMQKPLPVDGDSLPEIVHGYKTPSRLCPPFTRPKLTDDELTYLRKLARPLPTHFVLGRNRKLQGLAAAILKLWEKCHIAKIAVKWGVPNTDNEQMANELKNLTGGVLLLRNKFLIILYRGKDFIPSEVAKVVTEREMELMRCQLQEEAARLKACETFTITDGNTMNSGIVGTLSEFHSIDSENGNLKKGKTEVEVQLEAERVILEKQLKDQERKLLILKKKIEKSAKILEKLKNTSRFSEQDPDLEIISEEERECLREMGLKTDSSLVLGRRGVYDGVIEGMHQHWKHKEIVKVITMQKRFTEVLYTAERVEAESGGILVSIIKIKEGHAIIVYRGKNYKRPKSATLNLLNKKEALSRSLEIQRLGSLKFFASQREQAIKDLKCKLAELKELIAKAD